MQEHEAVTHESKPEAPRPLAERIGAQALRRRRIEAAPPFGRGNCERDCLTAGQALQMLLLHTGLRCLGLHARGVRNTQDLRLREEEVFLPSLPPALDGFRLLHLSDLHFGRTLPAHENAVCLLLEGVTADLCAVTGDFRFGHYGPFDHVVPAVRRMLDGLRLRYGAYAVLGNHDTLAFAEAVEGAGLRVLFNEGLAVGEGDSALWLAGVDDPHLYRMDDLDAALRGAPTDMFRILLAHSPECAEEAAKKGIGLYLCGHTHGGQVRLPVLGAVKSNARCPRARMLGHWQVGTMAGFTSAGLGTTDAVLRFCCPPEANLFTLRRK
jgi:predicted MPP superfamily phosphohydrolase